MEYFRIPLTVSISAPGNVYDKLEQNNTNSVTCMWNWGNSSSVFYHSPDLVVSVSVGEVILPVNPRISGLSHSTCPVRLGKMLSSTQSLRDSD